MKDLTAAYKKAEKTVEDARNAYLSATDKTDRAIAFEAYQNAFYRQAIIEIAMEGEHT